jgi:septal ring factor EnvC (AmiA/AmiB activator)
MSGLVAVKYKREPIMLWYSFWSTGSPSSSVSSVVVVLRELEMVQQKIQQLQKDKEKFTAQLQAKRKISEKLEQLNKAKEQIEAIQKKLMK